MTVNNIPNIVLSSQVKSFELLSGSRKHMWNPEKIFEQNEYLNTRKGNENGTSFYTPKSRFL